MNKGEARNALARAVCFHRLGRLRDRGAEAQGHRASGLALVTAAIALWNSLYLELALEALRRRGEAMPDALLRHLAPLGWQHINLTGDYLWSGETDLGPGVFKPLREVRTLRGIAAAANPFPVRAAKRAILPVLWRRPKRGPRSRAERDRPASSRQGVATLV